MNAEIIAVGSELLLGQIVNSNARFISAQLAGIGINMFYHTVVGDNPIRLKNVIETAEKRSELIIFTGGLGPTKDDLTKETIANHLGEKLVIDEQALSSIELYFKRTNRQMTDNNKKQALILEGSQIFQNDHGMAPGMMLQTNKHIYILLPGPPKEMEPMLLKYVQPALLSVLQSHDQIVSRVLRFFGIGESQLETEIEDIIDSQDNPTIAPLAADGEVTLRLTAKHYSMESAVQLIEETERKILERVGSFFYGYDDTTLMTELSILLKEKKLTLSAAESLTGGMFQEELTSIPGSSGIFKGGVVCYSNEIKEKVLNVSQEIINQVGVVSAECAKALAQNVARLMCSDIGISFTGVAGPNELEGHPVGTVYIGISIYGMEPKVEKFQFGGNRSSNRVRSVKYGCYLLIKHLKEMQND